ncbi:MAG: hypothetical protein ACF8LL_01910 [Phycisphaerales bacterium]
MIWPTAITRVGALTFSLALTLTLTPAPTLAQAFPNFGGLEVRLGTASPENADRGFAFAADADLGAFGIGTLRVFAGMHRFGADLDRTDAVGELSATGARLALRFDPLARTRFSPFLGAALTAHSVSAESDNAAVEELLDGFYVGAAILGGAAWKLDLEGRYAAVLELRRTFASDIRHTSIELGLRWMPRAAGSYVIEP